MRVLVCGSRDWKDQTAVDVVLTGLIAQSFPELTVIEGGARGADRCAANWVEQVGVGNGIAHEQLPADWEKHGKAAGPIRNQKVLDEGKPDVVWAFKDNFDWPSVVVDMKRGGTEDMVRRAKAAGIPVYVVSRA